MSNIGLVSVDITLHNILYIQVLGLVSMSNDGLVSVDNSGTVRLWETGVANLQRSYEVSKERKSINNFTNCIFICI